MGGDVTSPMVIGQATYVVRELATHSSSLFLFSFDYLVLIINYCIFVVRIKLGDRARVYHIDCSRKIYLSTDV